MCVRAHVRIFSTLPDGVRMQSEMDILDSLHTAGSSAHITWEQFNTLVHRDRTILNFLLPEGVLD